jgi:hypothetical protein
METIDGKGVTQFITEISVKQREFHQYPAHLCTLRNGPGCPSRRLEKPNCHECEKSERDHDKLRTELARRGFTFQAGRTESNNLRRTTLMTSAQGTIFINSSGTIEVGSKYGGFNIIYVPFG